MKYHVSVNGIEHEVELEEQGGEVRVRFDGEEVEAKFDEVDRLGQAALYLGTRAYAVSIEGDTRSAFVTVAGSLYRVELEDERERAARQAEGGRASRGGDVTSVMPGVVVEVLVQEGDEVVEGQPLLILEAMKMQNEIPAPSAGRVARIRVQPGEAVGSGASLLQLDLD